MTETPALSVILATAGGFSSVRTTFRHLQAQTAANRLEVIVLAPDVRDFGLTSDDTVPFLKFQLVELGHITPIASANAEGVRRATAPVVVFSEDHAFPATDWAEALIARHRENWAAVGPVVRNGNPGSAVSWADYLIGYGPWHDAQPAGPARMLPGHNSSYKRDVLLRLGDKLAASLMAESVLHQALLESGAELYLENRAIVSHLNFAQWRVFLAVQYQNGRQYGACRSRDWPRWRRALYATASPLIPALRFARILNLRARLPRNPSPARIFAVTLAGLLADGIGQAAGYATGAGRSDTFLTNYEYDRVRFIPPEDSPALPTR